MQVMSTGGGTSEEAAGPVSDPQIERLIVLWLKWIDFGSFVGTSFSLSWACLSLPLDVCVCCFMLCPCASRCTRRYQYFPVVPYIYVYIYIYIIVTYIYIYIHTWVCVLQMFGQGGICWECHQGWLLPRDSWYGTTCSCSKEGHFAGVLRWWIWRFASSFHIVWNSGETCSWICDATSGEGHRSCVQFNMVSCECECQLPKRLFPAAEPLPAAVQQAGHGWQCLGYHCPSEQGQAAEADSAQHVCSTTWWWTRGWIFREHSRASACAWKAACLYGRDAPSFLSPWYGASRWQLRSMDIVGSGWWCFCQGSVVQQTACSADAPWILHLLVHISAVKFLWLPFSKPIGDVLQNACPSCLSD